MSEKLPKRISRTTVYESDRIKVHTDKVVMPSGAVIERYHQLEYPHEAVVVVITNPKKEICMVKALRYTTQRVEWELPAGGVDEGEDIKTAAARELKEEAGLIPEVLERVYTFNPDNGISTKVIHVVKGDWAGEMTEGIDEDEVAEVRWFSSDEINEMIRKNEITDGTSLVALMVTRTK